MDTNALQLDNFLSYILDNTPFMAAMESEIAKVSEVTDEELQQARENKKLYDILETVEAEIRTRKVLCEEIILVEKAVAILKVHEQAVEETLSELGTSLTELGIKRIPNK